MAVSKFRNHREFFLVLCTHTKDKGQSQSKSEFPLLNVWSDVRVEALFTEACQVRTNMGLVAVDESCSPGDRADCDVIRDRVVKGLFLLSGLRQLVPYQVVRRCCVLPCLFFSKLESP